MERELRAALERDELELHYQPQVDLTGGAVLGFEALLRWRHPRLGIIAAQPIVALAQETRLIAPLGLWVLRRACADARSWPASRPRALRVAINLSAQEVLLEDFVARLAGVLGATGLAPQRLELEITETAVATDAAVMASASPRSRPSAWSSRSMTSAPVTRASAALRRFRPDRLKIDRSFIDDLERDAGAAALVSAIIAMAHSLDLEVAAIAVENERQASFLRQRGLQSGPGLPLQPAAAGQRRGALAARSGGAAPPAAAIASESAD